LFTFSQRTVLLDISTLDKHDTQGMYKIYDGWPQIARESYEANLDGVDFKDIDHIVFSGMGGSGTIGDILSSILSKTNIHVNVVKGYHLPTTVDSNTLVVITSISGNTAETLTVLDSARKTDCKLIGFSSGGKIEKYCTKNNVEYRIIPMHHSPRTSLPAFLYSILKTLNFTIPVKKEDILESFDKMERSQKLISSSNLGDNNPSLNLAEWINGIPLVYYPWGLEAAAIRFKASLQENAKTHVITENVIEACHNGIVSWEKPSNVKPILIEGKDDYIKTKERWSILKEYFNENKIDYREMYSLDGPILSKIINLIYMLDYTSIYKATLTGIDPSPIKSIDFIKKKLNN